jgi:hypothetical protein
VNKQTALEWPSGSCKPIIATLRTPVELVAETGTTAFRDRDDLDWFEGAYLQIEGLGTVLIMKHDNNPSGLTALYVDLSCHSHSAGKQLIHFFGLSPEDVTWQAET